VVDLAAVRAARGAAGERAAELVRHTRKLAQEFLDAGEVLSVEMVRGLKELSRASVDAASLVGMALPAADQERIRLEQLRHLLGSCREWIEKLARNGSQEARRALELGPC
jgi:hypothetical protein